jgi:16S rRNA (guanine1207-N2)-methyltransferase
MTVAPESYYTWQTFQANLADEPVRWAGKPGLEAWNELRPSQRLIADQLIGEELGPGLRVLDLRCGMGVTGALAARRGAHVTLCDDNLVAAQAARRTLDLNGVPGQVIHGEPELGTPLQDSFDLVLLDAPRGREWVRHLLAVTAQALRPGGKLLLAGPNRGGIKGTIEDAGEIVGPCQVTRIKASCRLAVAEMSGQPSVVRGPRSAVGGQFEASVRGQTLRVADRPGVFAQRRGELDPGTRALIETLAAHLGEPGQTVLDLGCGCGVVGAVAARMGGLVTCVDASAAALQVTRETLGLNGVVEQAEVIASDSGGAVLGRRFDVVATNPPFHQGLGVDYDVARQFVRDAAHVLKPGGRLVLVANRFIRYEHVAAGLFSNVRTAYEDHRFRVLEAIK